MQINVGMGTIRPTGVISLSARILFIPIFLNGGLETHPTFAPNKNSHHPTSH